MKKDNIQFLDYLTSECFGQFASHIVPQVGCEVKIDGLYGQVRNITYIFSSDGETSIGVFIKVRGHNEKI